MSAFYTAQIFSEIYGLIKLDGRIGINSTPAKHIMSILKSMKFLNHIDFWQWFNKSFITNIY
jgi:hypothetical protein